VADDDSLAVGVVAELRGMLFTKQLLPGSYHASVSVELIVACLHVGPRRQRPYGERVCTDRDSTYMTEEEFMRTPLCNWYCREPVSTILTSPSRNSGKEKPVGSGCGAMIAAVRGGCCGVGVQWWKKA
jgi:hypothetical protein